MPTQMTSIGPFYLKKDNVKNIKDAISDFRYNLFDTRNRNRHHVIDPRIIKNDKFFIFVGR